MKIKSINFRFGFLVEMLITEKGRSEILTQRLLLKTSSLAGVVRRGILSFVAFEITAAAVGFATFRTLRRSEEKRKYLYLNWPSLSSTYYWVEDSISFGQLTGTRLRLSDQRRWAQIDLNSENIETD
ncbi:hypothetical protein B9Z55_002029 [Caenorhabditis nigoni]|nr:hypothetical protein B9Z55_002029 [Caenorhabditis nigoni]